MTGKLSKTISYGRQSISQADINAVVDVLKSDFLTQGETVIGFENALGKYFGARHVCAVANGTAALHLIGIALGWQAEDFIICPSLTFVATANSIVYSGATPEFVDICPASYTLDPNQVEERIKKLRSNGKRVVALIGVDYAGHPCDWQSLRWLADKYDLKLVNDNCHAMGATYKDNKKYAVEFADAVTQSYHPVKHITTGEGGAILTNSSDLDAKVKKLRTHGITKNPDQAKIGESWVYKMDELGFNYRITDFQSALGNSQLKRLDKFVERRREIASRYDLELDRLDLIEIPQSTADVSHSYHLYPLLIEFDQLKCSKTSLFSNLQKKGIALQVHYIPVHTQPYYRENFSTEDSSLKNTLQFYEQEVSLPIYPDLDLRSQELVLEELMKHVLP